MRGSRAKQLRRSNPARLKPGRVNGGNIGFELHSPNERARRKALAEQHNESSAGNNGEKNETSGELSDESGSSIGSDDSSVRLHNSDVEGHLRTETSSNDLREDRGS